MRKKFVGKKNAKKKKWKFKFLLFILLFIISMISTFKILLKSSIKINDKNLTKFLLADFKYDNNIFREFFQTIKKEYSPVNLLTTSYYDLVPKKIKQVNQNTNDYLIYLYNTHQEEKYAPSTFVESEVTPSVMMSSYIMEDVFNKNKFHTLVEERSIKELLNNNNWKYYKSYDASRIYLEDSTNTHKSLKYFIDVHRDSLEREKTTVQIHGKSYAKVIFLLGVENPNYQQNLEFITKINDQLNEKYPNLSKGIYKKGGQGVNGVYNQDYSKYTILIEIGGIGNNTTEVLNSTLAFAECFMEVIDGNEG